MYCKPPEVGGIGHVVTEILHTGGRKV